MVIRIISEGKRTDRTDRALTRMPETSGLKEIPVQISGIQSTLTRKV